MNFDNNLPDQFTKYQNNIFTQPSINTNPVQKPNQNILNNVSQQNQLNQLNQSNSNPPNATLLNTSLNQNLINMKNALFSIGTDIKNKQINSSTLLQGNKMLYIGIFLIIIVVIYLVLNNLFIVAYY